MIHDHAHTMRRKLINSVRKPANVPPRDLQPLKVEKAKIQLEAMPAPSPAPRSLAVEMLVLNDRMLQCRSKMPEAVFSHPEFHAGCVQITALAPGDRPVAQNPF